MFTDACHDCREICEVTFADALLGAYKCEQCGAATPLREHMTLAIAEDLVERLSALESSNTKGDE